MDFSSPSSSPTSSPKQITFYDAVLPRARGGTGSPSFSSSSSSSSAASSFRNETPSAPATPLHHSRGGVPFSWEKQPGIPKRTIFTDGKSNSLSLMINSDRKSETLSRKILPLPPPLTPRTDPDEARRVKRSNANTLSSSSRFAVPRDPFFAAFVECSKGGEGGFSDGSFENEFLTGAKVTRSISDRFGLVGMYGSCKRTCAVSESIVYLPTRLSTSSPARPPYSVIGRRR
ncbi:hypothetical protein LINGRAHAP2_LOCUS36382 [Linum grandiflorum]